MKTTTSNGKTYLGVLAQRAAVGVSAAAAAGVVAFSLMSASVPPAYAASCTDQGAFCSSYSSDCGNQTGCTCKFADSPDSSYGYYHCVS